MQVIDIQLVQRLPNCNWPVISRVGYSPFLVERVDPCWDHQGWQHTSCKAIAAEAGKDERQHPDLDPATILQLKMAYYRLQELCCENCFRLRAAGDIAVI